MKRDIWIFLFIIGCILFNWPIISIFKYDLSKYLFFVWIIFIALIYFMSLYSRKGDKGE